MFAPSVQNNFIVSVLIIKFQVLLNFNFLHTFRLPISMKDNTGVRKRRTQNDEREFILISDDEGFHQPDGQVEEMDFEENR